MKGWTLAWTAARRWIGRCISDAVRFATATIIDLTIESGAFAPGSAYAKG
jgi:hypothetical protein